MQFSHFRMQITAVMWSLKVHTKLKTKKRSGMIDRNNTRISAQSGISVGLASALKIAKKQTKEGKNLLPHTVSLVITHHSWNMQKQLLEQEGCFTTFVAFSRSSYGKAGHSRKVA